MRRLAKTILYARLSTSSEAKHTKMDAAQKKIWETLVQIRRGQHGSSYSFPSSLSGRDRFFIHDSVSKLGLSALSQGEGSERYITVITQRSPDFSDWQSKHAISSNSQQVAKALMNAKTYEEALHLVISEWSRGERKVNFGNVIIAIRQAIALAGNIDIPNNALFQRVFQVVVDNVQEMTPKETALMLLALAWVDVPNVIDCLLEQTNRTLANFNTQDISCVCQFFARRKQEIPAQLMDALGQQAERVLQNAEPEHLAHFLYSLTKHHIAPQITQLLIAQIERRASEMQMEDLTLVLMALGKSNTRVPDAFIETLLQSTEQKILQCEVGDLRIALQFLAKTGVRISGSLSWKILKQIDRKLGDFSLEELSNVVLSLSRCGVLIPPSLIGHFELQVEHSLPTLDASSLSAVVMACAYASITPPQFLNKLYARAEETQDSFDYVNTCTMLLALSRLKMEHVTERVVSVFTARLRELQGPELEPQVQKALDILDTRQFQRDFQVRNLVNLGPVPSWYDATADKFKSWMGVNTSKKFQE